MVDWQFDINEKGIQQRGMTYFATGAIRDENGYLIGDLKNHEFAVSKHDVELHMHEHECNFEEALEHCFAKMLRDLKRSRGVDTQFSSINGSIPDSFKKTKIKSNLEEIRKRPHGQSRPSASPESLGEENG